MPNLSEEFNHLKLGELAGSKINDLAISRLNDLGWPNRRQELWKYTDLSAMKKQDWNVVGLSSLQSPLPKGVTLEKITSFEGVQSVTGYEPAYPQQNSLFWLNQLIVEEGILLKIPADTVVDEPVNLQVVAEIADQTFGASMIAIEVGRGSKVSFVEAAPKNTQGALLSSAHMLVRESAKVEWVLLCDQSESAIYSTNHSVWQEAHSEVSLFSIHASAKRARYDLSSHMVGEQATCRLFGLYLGGADEHVDFHTALFHDKAYTFSEQLFKGILTDKARSVFNGKVKIAQDAQKVDSSQLNKTLLLSKDAEVDSKPELEIYADDVKAAHGATIGQIEPEEVFYLQSRGLKKEKAIEMLAYGFVNDVIERIEADSTREMAKSAVEEFVKNNVRRLGELY